MGTSLNSSVTTAMREGRTEEAVSVLESTGWTHDDPDLWGALAVGYFRLGWLVEADAALQRVLRVGPGQGLWIGELTEHLLRQGLPYSAQRVLRAAADAGLPPDSWETRLTALVEQHPVRRVSVYTPAYAAEDYLERCLASIHAQTYPIHEILVVDDRSPDGSTAIALRHGARVFDHNENRGLAASCNTALRHCTGEFLAKIDSDLELRPTWLERAMAAFADDRGGGVGGRLVEHRTLTIPDQWRRVFMAQHWGLARMDDAPGLFGADCVFRVEALNAVGGWNERYRTNFEDMDLSLRLKAAGWRLMYEPLAWGRHLRSDSLYGVLNNFWKWYSPPLQDQGAYESLAHAASVIGHNRSLAEQRVNHCFVEGCCELIYPSFLLYYWLCVRDVQHVARLGNAPVEVARQTALGIYLLARQQLHACAALSGRVIERALSDLKACVRGFLGEAEQAVLDADSQAVPLTLEKTAEAPGAIRRQLPVSDARYLEAFQHEPYLKSFGPGHGSLVDFSLRAVEADERERRETKPDRPRYVLFNPAVPRGTPETSPHEGASSRWLLPSRIEDLACRLRANGLQVFTVDAIALRLDEQEAHERVMGAEPAAVVYSAAEGGLDRIVTSARQIRLLGPERLRLILVYAGASAADPGRYPMFDETHAGIPDAWTRTAASQ